MIYKRVSAKEVIARIDNNFSIDYSDWISRTPLWIMDCLDELEVPMVYESVKTCVPIIDYTFELPCDLKLIEAIKYQGRRLDRLAVINHFDKCDLEEQTRYRQYPGYVVKGGYTLNHDGTASIYVKGQDSKTMIESERIEITIYYKILPLEFDRNDNIWYPLVPDNIKIKTAIEWYVNYHILLRGHVHPVFSLDSRNEITNPYLQWEIWRKKARNSGFKMDHDQREQLSKVIRNFLTNVSDYYNESFDNTAQLGT